MDSPVSVEILHQVGCFFEGSSFATPTNFLHTAFHFVYRFIGKRNGKNISVGIVL
jgi:hypothetical protein